MTPSTIPRRSWFLTCPVPTRPDCSLRAHPACPAESTERHAPLAADLARQASWPDAALLTIAKALDRHLGGGSTHGSPARHRTPSPSVGTRPEPSLGAVVVVRGNLEPKPRSHAPPGVYGFIGDVAETALLEHSARGRVVCVRCRGDRRDADRAESKFEQHRRRRCRIAETRIPQLESVTRDLGHFRDSGARHSAPSRRSVAHEGGSTLRVGQRRPRT
jgi:hypothetical protein